jgi:hypothetical protein
MAADVCSFSSFLQHIVGTLKTVTEIALMHEVNEFSSAVNVCDDIVKLNPS